MTGDQTPEPTETAALARQARDLLAAARHGALATVAHDGGHPHASLVTVATDALGAPVLLISQLAVHTKNLLADPRASLLVAETGQQDPLAGARLTVIGRCAPTRDPGAAARYLAAHPAAAQFAGFADFSFWRMEIESGHFVGGFGRIRRLAREALLVPSP